jgi:hypothetical protein
MEHEYKFRGFWFALQREKVRTAAAYMRSINHFCLRFSFFFAARSECEGVLFTKRAEYY